MLRLREGHALEVRGWRLEVRGEEVKGWRLEARWCCGVAVRPKAQAKVKAKVEKKSKPHRGVRL